MKNGPEDSEESDCGGQESHRKRQRIDRAHGGRREK